MSAACFDAPLIAGAALFGAAGLGVSGAAVRAATAAGAHGPGLLYNDWDAGDDAKAFRALVVSAPSSGALFVHEDGSFTLTGAADGSYAIGYRLFVDGIDLGLASAAIVVGIAGNFALTPAGLGGTVQFGAPSVSFSAPAAFAVTNAGGISSSMALGIPTLILVPLSGEPEPVTLAEARLACRLSDGELDAELADLIATAREQAEHITSRFYRRQIQVQPMSDWPLARYLLLPLHDPAAVVITYRSAADPDNWTTFAADQFRWGPLGHETSIRLRAGVEWPTLASAEEWGEAERVRIAVTVGPSDVASVPACVRRYILASVAAWLEQPAAQRAGGQLSTHPLFERLLDPERLWA